MERQSQAAGPRQVEWYFAEQGPADYFAWYAKENEFTNIHVFWMPIEYLKSWIVIPWFRGPAPAGFAHRSIHRTFTNREA